MARWHGLAFEAERSDGPRRERTQAVPPARREPSDQRRALRRPARRIAPDQRRALRRPARPRWHRRRGRGAPEDREALLDHLRGLDGLRTRLRRARQDRAYREGGAPGTPAAHLPGEAQVRPPGGSEHLGGPDLRASTPTRYPGSTTSGEVPQVHVPKHEVRAWRRTITYRNRMVGDRTATKCRIRAFLRSLGIVAPKSLWTKAGRTRQGPTLVGRLRARHRVASRTRVRRRSRRPHARRARRKTCAPGRAHQAGNEGARREGTRAPGRAAPHDDPRPGTVRTAPRDLTLVRGRADA